MDYRNQFTQSKIGNGSRKIAFLLNMYKCHDNNIQKGS